MSSNEVTIYFYSILKQKTYSIYKLGVLNMIGW